MGEHIKHRTHTNSSSSYRAGRAGRATTEVRVKAVYRACDHPLSDREVGQALKMTDLNGCKPIITALIQAGELKEVGKMTCPVTGRMVRLVTVVDRKGHPTLFAMKKSRLARLRSDKNASK